MGFSVGNGMGRIVWTGHGLRAPLRATDFRLRSVWTSHGLPAPLRVAATFRQCNGGQRFAKFIASSEAIRRGKRGGCA
jgi:hypothetical protein